MGLVLEARLVLGGRSEGEEVAVNVLLAEKVVAGSYFAVKPAK